MKRVFLFLLLVSMVQCTKKEQDVPSTPPVLPAPGHSDETRPPTEPVIPTASLPHHISPEMLASRQMFTMHFSSPLQKILQLAGVVTPQLHMFPEAAQAAAMLPGILPSTIDGLRKGLFEDSIPAHWRPFLRAADSSAGLLVSLVTRQSDPKKHTHLMRFSTDISELEVRLSRGDFGKFTRTQWGGWISMEGHLNHKDAPNIFLAFDAGQVIVSSDLDYLHAALDVLKRYEEAVPRDFFLYLTVHNLNTYSEFYYETILSDVSQSDRRKMGPILRFLRPEIENMKHFHFALGFDGNLTGTMDMSFQAVDNPQSPMVKTLMTPVDITDLAAYLPSKPILFGLDKSSLDFIKPLYSRIQQELVKEMKNITDADDRLMLGEINSWMDLVNQFFDNAHDAQAAAFSLRKDRLHSGGMFHMKSPDNAKAFVAAITARFTALNPRTLLPRLSPEARKELSWLPRVFEVRTRNMQVNRKPAAVITMTFRWNNLPKMYRDEGIEILSQWLGNQLELAIVQDGDRLFMMAGSHWRDELTEMMALKGRIPEPRLKQAAESTMSLSGLDMSAFAGYLLTEFLKLKFPVPMDTETRTTLQAVLKQISSQSGDSWMAMSAGLQADQSFRLRSTMEKNSWLPFFAWLVVSRNM